MKQMGQGRKMHYVVKWKGYCKSDNSWEPEKNLNMDELIAGSFRPKKTKARKVFIRTGQMSPINSSPSHLNHHTHLFPKEMLSESAISLCVSSTSPVRALSPCHHQPPVPPCHLRLRSLPTTSTLALSTVECVGSPSAMTTSSGAEASLMAILANVALPPLNNHPQTIPLRRFSPPS